MQKLDHWPLALRRRVKGVLTDIDDTLTTDGAITPDALQALASLREVGLPVIAVTGRPVGWSEQLASAWPLDALVAENGAVALVPGIQNGLNLNIQAHRLLSKIYQQDAATRMANFARMQAVAKRVLAEVPGTVLAQDSSGRETDIAFDHSEFTHLPQARIDQVVALLQSEGMNATVSSIHVNAWFGTHDKLSGARWILKALWGRDLDAERDEWVYVGDSTNDQVMFGFFPQSIGVSNVQRFVSQLVHRPRYITSSERGAGFAEVAARVLDARRGA